MDFIVKVKYDEGENYEEINNLTVSTDSDISEWFEYDFYQYNEDTDEEENVNKIYTNEYFTNDEFYDDTQTMIQFLINKINEDTNYLSISTQYNMNNNLLNGNIFIDGLIVSFEYEDKKYVLDINFTSLSDETYDFYRDSGIWWIGGDKFDSNSKSVKKLLKKIK